MAHKATNITGDELKQALLNTGVKPIEIGDVYPNDFITKVEREYTKAQEVLIDNDYIFGTNGYAYRDGRTCVMHFLSPRGSVPTYIRLHYIAAARSFDLALMYLNDKSQLHRYRKDISVSSFYSKAGWDLLMQFRKDFPDVKEADVLWMPDLMDSPLTSPQ